MYRLKFPCFARFGLFFVMALAIIASNVAPASAMTPTPPHPDERVQAVAYGNWTVRCMLSPSMLGMVRNDGKATDVKISPKACDGPAPYQVLAIAPPKGLTFSGNLKSGFGEAHFEGETYWAYCTNTPGNMIVYFIEGGKTAPLEFSVPHICQAGKA